MITQKTMVSATKVNLRKMVIDMLRECPKCGNTEVEIYYKISGRGTMFFNMESGETDCGQLYDSLDHKPYKYAECTKCRKRIPYDQLDLSKE